jgi:glycosyltransferase involved in cell wall biosynthesis
MVNPKNHKEFADRIVLILKNNTVLESLSKMAIEKIKVKFSETSIFNSYIKYYKSLL